MNRLLAFMANADGVNIQYLGVIQMFKRVLAMLLLSFAVIDVHAANVAPTVSLDRLGGDQVIAAPATIELLASAQDSDGTVVSLSIYDGSTLLATVSSGANDFTWTNVPIGTHTLTAVATDNAGASTTSAPLIIRVADNVAPTISITSPVNNVPVVVPSTVGNVTLEAAVSDAVGHVTWVNFYRDSTPISGVWNDLTPWRLIWLNAPVGTYTITAQAIDDSGASTMSAPVTLIVRQNAAPTVTLSATLTNATAPGTIVLTAAATDSDDGISKVEFFNGTTLLATKTQAPFAYTWSNVAAGTYSLTARATDNLGVSTTTQSSVVTVTSGGAQIFYVYADQIENPREITNAAGLLVWRADATEPFGANLPNENPSGLGAFTYSPRFPGQYFDKETGLHYNYFRDYDPQTGRYIQSDPIGLDGGINTYVYVSNSPLIGTDHLGLLDFGNSTQSLQKLTPMLQASKANPYAAVGSIAFGLGMATYAATHENEEDCCSEKLKALYAAMNEVEGRLVELYFDKLNLKMVAQCRPDPSLPKGSGSWNGHIQQLENQQTRLRNAIKDAIDSDCKVPPFAWQLAYIKAPPRRQCP